MTAHCLLLASARALFARSFGKLVQSERPGSRLLTAGSLAEVEVSLRSQPVDVLLLDGGLALADSLEATFARLRATATTAGIVLVLDEADDTLTDQAMALGAAGVLLKAAPPGVIARSLALVLAGETCRPTPLTAADTSLPEVLCERLNERERRLLQALMRGESITSVSRLTGTSPQHTVREVRRILAIVRGSMPERVASQVTLH